MMRADKAQELFLQGYSCAQAVVIAFGDVTGLPADTAARMASSFGGGMGRLREVCGAVSGAFLVLGLAEGYADPADRAAKARHYARVQQFAQRFRARNGSIVCRELLGLPGGEAPQPAERTADYYRKRPCAKLVYDAAEILDGMLAEQNGTN